MPERTETTERAVPRGKNRTWKSEPCHWREPEPVSEPCPEREPYKTSEPYVRRETESHERAVMWESTVSPGASRCR